MAQAIRFDSSVDIPTQYVVASTTGVVNAETTAITVQEIEYLSTSVASVSGNTQATLYIKFVKGSLTNCSIKVYGSYVGDPAATDWYQEVVETDSTGVATLDAFSIVLTATATIAYHFPIGAYKALKITVGSTGTITSSAITLTLGLRNN